MKPDFASFITIFELKFMYCFKFCSDENFKAFTIKRSLNEKSKLSFSHLHLKHYEHYKKKILREKIFFESIKAILF
jgi:hypothetical protein